MRHARLLELIRYDPDTGEFFWLSARGCRAAGSVAGTVARRTGYVYISVDGDIRLAHRLAWFYMAGVWPKHQIDHRNRIKHDNRWSNLREATAAENSRNAPARVLLKGVTWHKGGQKWMAQIKVNNRNVYLGLFTTAQEAHDAYVEAARLHHTEFASVA